VAIDIPTMLVHLRSRVPHAAPERAAMAAVGWAMRGRRRWRWTLRAGRVGRVLGRRRGVIRRLPLLSSWTRARDLPRPPEQTFGDWWARR
jgi:L-lactate dehydrogenase complex protein LldF